MANSKRVTNIQIGNGTSALPTAGASVTPTTITNGVIGVLNETMVAMTAGQTISDTSKIYLVQGTPDSTNYMKFSFPINGAYVQSYKGESYSPATRDVWAVGYNRKTAAGAISVTNNADYTIYINVKSQKDLYGERPYRRDYSYTSASTDTGLEIANAFKTQINSDNTGGALDATAITVGNGTGVYGLTGATAWGIEITSTIITNQYFNTQYQELRSYFTIEVNDAFILGTPTTVTNISHMSYGQGTYNTVYTQELFDFGYEGVTNRRLWPIPVLNSSVQDLATATTITQTATITTLEDKVTFSADVTTTNILVVGDFITINSIAFEIKYFISSTVAIVTAVNSSATQTTQAVVRKLWYATITIEVNGDPNLSDGVNMTSSAKQTLIIALPQGIASSASNIRSTQLLAVEAILNPWMASLPRAFANISI